MAEFDPEKLKSSKPTFDPSRLSGEKVEKGFVPTYGEGSFDAGPSAPVQEQPIISRTTSTKTPGLFAGQEGQFDPTGKGLAGDPTMRRVMKESAIKGIFGAGSGVESLLRSAFLPSEIKEKYPKSMETLIPTPERAAKKYGFGDVPEAYKPASEFAGMVGEQAALLGAGEIPAIGKKGVQLGSDLLGKTAGMVGETLVGGTTKTVANLANRAEDLGFKLEPRQLRASDPKGSPGFGVSTSSENQKIANELASAKTGVKVKEINPEFVGERLKDIGDEYKKIFGQPLKVDRQLATDLEAMAAFERAVRPADVRTITAAADNVVGKFSQAQAQVQAPISAIRVEGEILQRLRNEMSYLARTATDGQTRKVAGDFVEKIDSNISRNHKDLVKPLEKANREYAATKALQELIEKGGIQGGNISLERLGNHLAQNVYGFGAGTARHPLTELGTLGRELKIRGRFEGVETPSGAISGLFSKTGQLLNLPGRMQIGRSIQRRLPVE